uniref:Uncharacterized protein n=1 Tax=Globisporangium ultimum (strain ATCC 200006 / CBS 805.95 / DAOM BR144) TaxID=431595 RepID=K3X264_GLOUD
MDWEANLAAIIKCTDANLEQQFRQFADMTVDLTTFSPDTPQQPFRGSDAASTAGGGDGIGLGKYFERQQSFAHENSVNLGTEYLRETMASNQRHHGASTRFASAPPTFADHFRKRKERKRSGGESAHRQRHEQSGSPGARFEENPDEDGAEYDNEPNINNQSSTHQYARRPRLGGHSGIPYQMYNSPTYDIAQMMEQVRLSLKLEVDARAAIAERQLSALLQLCKTSTDEMDRLRVEVCANDRQLHTLEQVQSKLRQELTTQKDIGFHLQSMCGKDESWRMQAENQLLELRQMVAAIREQGNSLHATSQEKLSRAELLVQFNACIEPIKAQFQANLQHQAQQIAEITRTTSSSSLLLDALTQKVNRGLMDEVSELRNEMYALKSHVTKMTTMLDSRNVQRQEPVVSAPAPAVPVKDPAEEEERARQKAKRKAELVNELQSQVLGVMDERVRDKVKELESSVSLRLEKWQVLYDQCVAMQTHSKIACQEHHSTLATSIESQLKALQQQLHSEVTAITRGVNDRVQQVKHETTTAAAALVDAKAAACQTRQIDLLKMI